MAEHVSHEAAVRGVYKGLALLAAVTGIEVVFSLFGKGHILGNTGLQDYSVVIGLVAIILIALSLYKAYFIIFEFMHMGYEVKGLALSVLLPVLLLVWALIAFFYEGAAWKGNREKVQERNEIKKAPASSLLEDAATYHLGQLPS